MAKNEISLDDSRPVAAITLPSLKKLSCLLARTAMIRRVAQFCSELTEEDISALQIVYYLYAQLAALVLCLPVAMETGWRACALMVCALSLGAARKAGRKA